MKEYKVLEFGEYENTIRIDLERKLNYYAHDNWQVIFVQIDPPRGYGKQYQIFLEREKT